MPEMQKKSGVTRLVSEISCVVDHAKLPNLVIVAVVGLIYFWRKMKAFRPLTHVFYLQWLLILLKALHQHSQLTTHNGLKVSMTYVY